MKKINIVTILFTILVLIIGFIFIHKLELNNTTLVFNNIDNIFVDAESCIVLNKNNEIAYSKNIHKKLLPASITKILTCITAIELLPLDYYIFITPQMVNTTGSKVYLQVGDFIKVEDLLYGLMLSSGNDAAKAIECSLTNDPYDFVYYMNLMCRKIGMNNSYFNNGSGLDENTSNYTTAYDMALLTNYAINNPKFLKIYGTKTHKVTLTNHTLYFKHKHRLLYTCDNIIGGKTGYTKKAGRTLVSTFYKNNDYITVVTFNSHNDWEIHSKFNNIYFNEKNKNFVRNSSINLNLAFCERLRGKKDD